MGMTRALKAIPIKLKDLYLAQPLLCNRVLAIGAGAAAKYGIDLDWTIILPVLIGTEFVISHESVYSPKTVAKREAALTDSEPKPFGRFVLPPDPNR